MKEPRASDDGDRCGDGEDLTARPEDRRPPGVLLGDRVGDDLGVANALLLFCV